LAVASCAYAGSVNRLSSESTTMIRFRIDIVVFFVELVSLRPLRISVASAF